MSEENQVTNEPVEPPQQEVAQENETKIDPEILELKNKNLKLEQAMTRQSYELGELRKLKPLVDKVLLEKKEPVDFFENPEKAVDSKIEENPKVKELQDKLNRMEQLENLNQLKQSHPDYVDIVKDNQFLDWVGKSNIRTELLQKANAHYDYEAANELFSTWKDRRVVQNTESAKANQEMKKKQDLSKAKVHSGSGTTGKKTYSRLELIRLKQSDPEAYRQMNVAELYASGRVR